MMLPQPLFPPHPQSFPPEKKPELFPHPPHKRRRIIIQQLLFPPQLHSPPQLACAKSLMFLPPNYLYITILWGRACHCYKVLMLMLFFYASVTQIVVF